MTITITDQLACARRELRLRQTAYRRWVHAGRMNPDTAVREIECMEAIVKTLEGLVPPEPKQGALL